MITDVCTYRFCSSSDKNENAEYKTAVQNNDSRIEQNLTYRSCQVEIHRYSSLLRLLDGERWAGPPTLTAELSRSTVQSLELVGPLKGLC